MAKLKVCKSCRTEIDGKAKKCPNCGSKQGIPGIVKLFIGLVIICIGIVGCVSSCTKSVDDAVEEVKNSYNDINGKTKFKVNETFQNSYEKITMTEVNTNFTDYGEYSEPASGKKYVMVKFEIENISEKDELYVSSYDFNASADDVAINEGYIDNDKYNDISATLGKGKKSIGYIIYEAPKNANKITIDYNPNFWVDGTAIEFIVK